VSAPERAPFGPEDLAAAANVSRETLARLKAYAGVLADWNARHNLVSARSLDDVWRRHFWDSAQLVRFIPDTARTLVDLGTGAGFPGLVLAELFRGRLDVTLIEATAKKCRFLEAVAGRLALPITISNTRIEDAPARVFDVVTARACAPLPRLLLHAQHFAGPKTKCLFLKGQNVEVELTEARKSWRMQLGRHQSLSDPLGVVLEIGELAPNVRR
jgi:16S rRNA (guanine527-N7)-methyltransferase